MQISYRRILIVGCGGAGKSTLARALGQALGLPVVHLDRLWWLPGWQNRTPEEFDLLLQAELAKDAWIIDGNYLRTFAMRLARAEFCIFLDFDVETCLAGMRTRVAEYAGRTRPDMSEGCPERYDPDFEIWVREFNTEVRPAMLETLAACGVPYRVFTTRAQLQRWCETPDPEMWEMKS
jgi:adenylate kinase family enzyme